MTVRRFFYVTQDALVVWQASGRNMLEEVQFASTDEGYREFARYLENAPQLRAWMVVDVIEEEFVTDALPKVSSSDRRSLIERRLKKRFARTPFRVGVFLGDRRRASDQYNAVYSAITNHELVDPWLEIVEQHKAPLIGVTSVPLISVQLFRQFSKLRENSMLVSQHQGGRLRLVFTKSGQPVSARLSRVMPVANSRFGEAFNSEVVQSRKYLERSRMLDAEDTLNVYLISSMDVASNAFEHATENGYLPHTIDVGDAARKLGIAGTPSSDHLEALYLAQCSKNRPKFRYETDQHVNYSLLLRFRQTLISAAVSTAVACSVAAGLFASGAYAYRSQTQEMETQISRLEETYRREHKEFEPIRANSHEMKLAVDTGDYIARNSLPIDWVLSELGRVMDDHPDMYIDKLSWTLEAAADPDASNGRAVRRDQNMPVPIPEVVAVTAKVGGEIRPYDGNLRRAFEKIDWLASDLQARTTFERVAVAEYPIDARPGAALSGEIRRRGDDQLASFALVMTLRIDDEAD